MPTRSDSGINEYTVMKRMQIPAMTRIQIEFEAVEIISRFNIRLYTLDRPTADHQAAAISRLRLLTRAIT